MRALVVLLLFILLPNAWASSNCTIHDMRNPSNQSQNDALALVIRNAAGCPANVRELKEQFLSLGAEVQPAMVANRGRHNPDLGSFSFFETVINTNEENKILPGEVFFGHFTKRMQSTVVLDQQPENGKLMIEAIAWDRTKQAYNFYELIGTDTSADWFYRGDSFDVLKDNAFIYRDPPPHTPKYGRTLRCSACHSSGGPIMKELEFPHNDWWTTERPLNLGPNHASAEVQNWLQTVIDAAAFAKYVKAGIEKLETSPAYIQFRAKMSLQEQLRPLFCENEMNLQSDTQSTNDLHVPVEIPTNFIVSPLFSHESDANINLPRGEYLQLLAKFRMKFPETKLMDADHAWLTPVKSFSDLLAIQSLLDQNIVDEKFVADVLAVDFQKPLFSKKRCQLLKLLPDDAKGPWRSAFIDNLKQSDLSGSKELLEYLQNPKYTMRWHRNTVQEYLLSVQSRPATLFPKLLNIRKAVTSSEISKNPLGQILEPGFRVIFPVPTPSLQ